MGVLSKILPHPVLRYLQKAIIPPKTSRGKYFSYTDTLVILRIPKDAPEPAFRLLKDVVNSVHDSCPAILRCEIHSYVHKHTNLMVHITLRFNNTFNAMNLKVNGTPFQSWLEQQESEGFWTCIL
ncbi:MAG: hypothetical protein Q9200_005605 [Gallowayella weberi]